MKKNKNLFLFTVSLFCIFALSFNVSADSNLSISFSPKSGILTVTGKTEINPQNAVNDITMQVLKPNKTLNDLAEITPSNYYDALQNAVQIMPVDDGSFNFSYKVNSIKGIHLVRFVFASGESKLDSFVYTTEADEKAVLSSFSRAAGIQNIKEIISSYNYLFDGFELYESLCVQYPDKSFLDGICLAMLQQKTYGSLGEVVEKFQKETVTAAIRLAGNEEEVQSLITAYESLLGIESNTVYTELYKAFEDMQLQICSFLTDEDFSDADNFLTSLYDNIVLVNVNTLSNWSGISSVFEKSEVYLRSKQFDFDSYNKLGNNKEKVNRELINENYADIESFKDAFNKATFNVQNGDDNKKAGGNSPGGGSVKSSIKLDSTTEAAFNKNDIPDVLFTDLADCTWAQKSIETLAKKGIINGKENKKFCPDDTITREEFVKLIVCALGLQNEIYDCSFADVSKEDWFYNYAAIASKHGIVNGVGNNSFGKGMKITRQELATIVYRAYKNIRNMEFNEAAQQYFNDHNSIADYAIDAVYAIKNKGVINGFDDGAFMPTANATRAESAKIIYEILNLEGVL